MTHVIRHRPTTLPLAAACRALGVNRSTVYARGKAPTAPSEGRSRRACHQPRALSEAERQHALDVLHSARFCDQPPTQVFTTLLDEGRYLCSVSTLHRLLRRQGEHGERRHQRPAQHHAIPRLCASQPNQVWTWDITKLATVQRHYLSLYIVMDLYSRYIVAWMLSYKENSALAQQLMHEAIARYGIAAQQLTLHQDRGSPMIARGYLDLLGELGVTCSHSRPRVSNDNAFSESQFKTLKYQPDFPGRFDDIAHAQHWCAAYVEWYNQQHHHSALAGFTPEQVFTLRYPAMAAQRAQVLDQQYARHPERFVRGKPTVRLPPAQVFINPLMQNDGSVDTDSGVNFPTLPYVKKSLSSI